MAKKVIAAIILVAIIIVAFIFICPAVFQDLQILPQEAQDALNSDVVSQVPIEWQ